MTIDDVIHLLRWLYLWGSENECVMWLIYDERYWGWYGTLMSHIVVILCKD